MRKAVDRIGVRSLVGDLLVDRPGAIMRHTMTGSHKFTGTADIIGRCLMRWIELLSARMELV